jgi:salicylate hydroxylase
MLTLIAGGGIGGLSLGLALAQVGQQTKILEKSKAFYTKTGAGLQLSPNATRILQNLGLGKALKDMASYPQRLVVRDLGDARVLADMPLNPDMQNRYGAPYLCLYRPDLQDLLLDTYRSVTEDNTTVVLLDESVEHYSYHQKKLQVETKKGNAVEGDVLIGADGIWSTIRKQTLIGQEPHFYGQIAYRACLKQSILSKNNRSQNIELWLGQGTHIVTYPVRCNEMLNIVWVRPKDSSWEQGLALKQYKLCSLLNSLLEMVNQQKCWSSWPIYAGPVLQHVNRMVPLQDQPVALLGDAIHSMRPHLAQGAAMAIEDAYTLAKVLSPLSGVESPPLAMIYKALQEYAHQRWQRNARVQTRAMKYGKIYAARGFYAVARNTAIRLLGKKVLNQDWLYRHTF